MLNRSPMLNASPPVGHRTRVNTDRQCRIRQIQDCIADAQERMKTSHERHHSNSFVRQTSGFISSCS